MKVYSPILLAASLMVASHVHADKFGSGENQFEIPFVTIGSPGNEPDTTGVPNPAGSVPYNYRIGKFEVPEEAIRKANTLSELAGDPLGITLDDRGLQKPATGLSWFEAARFVNWLNEEKGFSPAYNFDASGAFQLWSPGDPGYNPSNLFRNADARYFLPSVDEWYKAAFYDPAVGDYWDYPAGSNDPPTPVSFGTDPGTAVWNQPTGPADVMFAGGESPFGTVGQGGNVSEWQETASSGVSTVLPSPDVRAFRGDDWAPDFTPDSLSSSSGSADRATSFPGGTIGFRIASVPEPSSVLLLIASLLYAVRRPPYLVRGNTK